MQPDEYEFTLGTAYGLWRAFGGDGLPARGAGFALYLITFGSVVAVYWKKGILKIRKPEPTVAADGAGPPGRAEGTVGITGGD